MKVLVAEDDPPSRYLLGAILKPQGHEVISASNGEEALLLLKDESADLIISDLLMPKMDGFQLLRICKTDPDLKTIPFIVYTATYTDEKNIGLARDLGADRVLIKPVDPEELMRIISEFTPDTPGSAVTEPVIAADEKEKYLEKYSETIVSKLDDKVAELQKLNRLLRAIRRINQTMIHVKDVASLFEHACTILINETDYSGSWIVHLDEEGRVDLSREEGCKDACPDLIGRINDGRPPACIQKVFSRKKEVFITKPDDHESDCPVGWHHPDMQCMIAGLSGDGRITGMIGVILPPGQTVSDDETSLFSEIADDVSYAIGAIARENERKEIEEAKLRSEKKYRELFNNAADGIFLHELKEDGTPGKFLEVNDAACSRLGYTREEILKKEVSDINTLGDQEEAPEIIGELIRDGHVTFEGYHVCKDGSLYPVEVSTHVFPMDDHVVALSICRDITERKEMEKQIASSIQQIEENMTQLAILNDEIRNPLAVIVARVNMATEEEVSRPIIEQAKRIDEIVNRLDNGWLQSEKVWNFLHRYYGMGGEKGERADEGGQPPESL